MKKIMITLFTILLFGCISKPEIVKTLEPIVINAADMAISLEYLAEDQLISLYGKETNVFANYPGLLPKKKVIVFKLDLSSTSTSAQLDINDISLKIGDVTGLSRNKKQLLRDWNFYIKENSDILQAKKMVKDRMYNDTILITPENPQSAWIVFLDTFPEDGEAMLTINMTTSDGESGTIDIPLDFKTSSN